MPPVPRSNGQFKRQVVFRISPDDWPLLEHAASEHGSIQAAIIAGLRALSTPETLPAVEQTEATTPKDRESPPTDKKQAEPEEIPAREAARLLAVKTSTVSGYIRTGRLPGHYNTSPGNTGWVTTRTAVTAYKRQIRNRR